MSTRKIFKPLFLISSLVLFNIPALANGIPVMFAVTAIHVLFINTIVMVIETQLVKLLSSGRVIFWFIILANIASIFLAYVLTDFVTGKYFHDQWFGLEKGMVQRHIFISGIFIFILLTILIEWPFYYLALTVKVSWMQSLKYATITNLLTNIPIAFFYLTNDAYYYIGD